MDDFAKWFLQQRELKLFQFEKPYTIQQLAKDSGSSMYQVRQALPDLLARSWILTKPGVGVFVIPPEAAAPLEPLGVIVPELKSAFIINYLEALWPACQEQGFRPVIEVTFGDAHLEVDSVRRLSPVTNGIILLKHGPKPDWGAIRDHIRTKPWVLVEPRQNPGFNGVKLDMKLGAREALVYLAGQMNRFGAGRKQSIFILADRSDPEAPESVESALSALREAYPNFAMRYEVRDRVRLVRVFPHVSNLNKSRFRVEKTASIEVDVPDVSAQEMSGELMGRYLVRQLIREFELRPRSTLAQTEPLIGLFCVGDAVTRGALEALRRFDENCVPKTFFVVGNILEPLVYGSFISRLEPDYAGMVQETLAQIKSPPSTDRTLKAILPKLRRRRSSMSWEAALWHSTATGTAVIKKQMPGDGRIELKFANPGFLLLNDRTFEDVRDKQPDEYSHGGEIVLLRDLSLLQGEGPLLTCEELPLPQTVSPRRGRFTMRWRLPEEEPGQWIASLGFRFLPPKKKNFPIEVQQLFAQRSHYENEPPDVWLKAFFDYAPCTIAVHDLTDNRLLYINFAFAYMLAGNRASKGNLPPSCLALWQEITGQNPDPNPRLILLAELRDKLLGTRFGEQPQTIVIDGKVNLKSEPALFPAVFAGKRRILRWLLYSADAEPIAVASLGFDESAILKIAEIFSRTKPSADAHSSPPAQVPLTSLGLIDVSRQRLE